MHFLAGVRIRLDARDRAANHGPMSHFELLLSHHSSDGSGVPDRPIERTGLDAADAAAMAVPGGDSVTRLREDPDPDGHLIDRGGDPNDLRRQGWCVIAPAGDSGDRYLAAVRPLIEHRAGELGRDWQSLVRRFPGPLSDAQVSLEHACGWVRDAVDPPGLRDRDIPWYRLLLGDLHEIPYTIQQALCECGPTGRLAFDHLEAYQAYAAKVLAWEQKPSAASCGDAMFYTADDGSPAIEQGHAAIMETNRRLLQLDCDVDDIEARELIVRRTDADSADELLALTTGDVPGVLITLSHGEGAPVRGWASSQEQRRFQGGLCLGRSGRLYGDDLAQRAFLPGGVWFMQACFGVGTPARSQYAELLPAHDSLRGVRDILDLAGSSYPGPDWQAFVAALPRAALSNPDGPLAIIGNVDLAWTYGFTDEPAVAGMYPDRLRNSTHAWLADMIGYLLRHSRVGVAMQSLTRTRERAHTEIINADSSMARARSAGQRQFFAAQRGRAWMRRADLGNRLLLGDPAVRLPLARLARG
jgi:hypothetical protein